MLRGEKSSEFTPISSAELSKYVFALSCDPALSAVCSRPRREALQAPPRRLQPLRRFLDYPDIFLCADPSAQLPKDSANHLRALFRSTQWSLFLFCGVPLFLAAAERERRGLAVLVVAGMALQRSAAALLTQSTTNIALAVMALRPMWIVVSMVAGAREHRRRGAQHLV